MKPLKILLGNNTLSLLAGSETWTYTLALALKDMGHHVACFSPDLGVIAKKLMESGVPCYNDLNASDVRPFSYVLEEKVDHDYDVIIANHCNIVEYLRLQFPRKPIISTIHGIIHLMEDGKTAAPEHPALESGVNQFVAVSEEVQGKLARDYSIDAALVRNFFDIKKLAALKLPAAGKPKRFLINTNYADLKDPYIIAVRDAAKHFDAQVIAVGQNFTQSFDLSRAIEDSDVVFGMGRSVLEGVAAGRLGIVHGRWGTGGVICEADIAELQTFNFSGRNARDGKTATAQELIEMIEKYYQPHILEWSKEYAARFHNATFAAEQYVRMARELTGETIVKKPQSNQGVDPLARPFRLAKNG